MRWAKVERVVIGITVAVFAGPAGVGAAAVSPCPAIVSVAPRPGQVVGIAHPVVMVLDAPAADRRQAERMLRIRSTPAMTGRFEWLDSTTVQWVPDGFWPAHSTVALSVGGLSTEITTGASIIGVADVSERTFTVTIDGLPAGAEPPHLPAPHALPHRGEEGVMLATMGRPQYPTPEGRYSVLAKDRSVVMDSSSVGIPVDDPDGYRLTVDHAVRISPRGLYVHPAPWALRSLGVDNTSHGCIGLSPADAEWYFNTAQIGDPVIIEQ